MNTERQAEVNGPYACGFFQESGRKAEDEMKTMVSVIVTFALAAVSGCQVDSLNRSLSGAAEFQAAAVPTGTNGSVDAAGGESASICYPDVADGHGPTILLGYDEETLRENPIHAFMYFIPLISPMPVESETSAGNRQQAGLVSYHRQTTSRSFCVACEFRMTGEGVGTYIFDPAASIGVRAEEAKPGETLTNVLDYIRFTGAGFGGIQVRGTIDGSTATVTQVDVEFNARGCESPVTIGLYQVKARNGQYSYADRSNEIVAQVNTLTFKRGERPRMGITVASIAGKAQKAGFFGRFKAALANLFIKPVKVDKVGNDTMLDFGYALLTQEPAFTFPKAENLRQATIVPRDHDYAKSGVPALGAEAEGERVRPGPALIDPP
jgi:hypothetical protein